MIVAVHVLIFMLVLFGVFVIILTKNIVHAAYALAVSLVGIAGMYVLLNAELLAVVQILIYAGGVVVLLSFGIMLTNRLSEQKVVTESRNRFLGFMISLSIFSGFSFLISRADLPHGQVEKASNSIEQIGISFLTEHIVAFELIAFILLVALVGSAYLAKMSSDE